MIRWQNAQKLFQLPGLHLMAIPTRYNTGYNIGVGGAVVRDGRLLLVRRASDTVGAIGSCQADSSSRTRPSSKRSSAKFRKRPV